MAENSRAPRRMTLAILSVITFLGFIDTVLLLPIISLYAEHLGASVAATGFIVGLYSIANTPANIIFGRIIDRIGKKIPLFVGLIGSALSLFLYSLCRLPVHLGMVRFMHGIFGGMVGPSTMSALSDCAGESRRGQVMGIYGVCIASATLVGYPASGFIATNWGYNVLFITGSALLILGSLAAMTLPRDQINACKSRTIGIGSIKGVIELVKRPGLRVAYAAIVSLYFCFGGLITLLPFHVRQYNLEAFHVGILLGVFSAFFILLQAPVGRMTDKIGRLKPAMLGILVCLGSLIALPFLENIYTMAIAMAFFGMGYGIIFPSVSSLVIDFSATEERGIATGVFHALLTVGVAVGAPVIGGLGQWLGVQIGLFACAATMMVALMVALHNYKNRLANV